MSDVPGAPPPPPPPRASGWDRAARRLALLLLLAIITVVYWVPFQLVGVWGASFVLASLTLLVANMGSRLHGLRRRLDELEQRLPPPGRPEPEPSPANEETAAQEQGL